MRHTQLCVSILAVTALVASTSAQTSITYSGSGGSIPDNGGFANPLILTITIPDSYPIVKIQHVRINGFRHTWVGDLIVRFEKQGGPQIALFQRMRGDAGPTSQIGDHSNLNGDYTFIPEPIYPTLEAVAITGGNDFDIPSGIYRPAGTSAGLNSSAVGVNDFYYDYDGFTGADTAGSWRLIISDHASLDVGSVQSWEIQFLVPEPASLIALGSGLVALGVWRRRKR